MKTKSHEPLRKDSAHPKSVGSDPAKRVRSMLEIRRDILRKLVVRVKNEFAP